MTAEEYQRKIEQENNDFERYDLIVRYFEDNRAYQVDEDLSDRRHIPRLEAHNQRNINYFHEVMNLVAPIMDRKQKC